MTAITRLTPVIPGSEPTTDIAVITVAAVDEIGARSADQIEAAAAAVEEAGKALGAKLRSLATAMRDHTRRASQEVSEFSLLAASASDTVRGIEKQITDKHT
jgi:hypothetical protein